MAIQTQKFIRKPLFVDAVRISNANFDEIVEWCQGEVNQDPDSDKKYIKVRVHNPKNPRQTKAFVGDWLLYTERGYKIYTNKAFHASFDKSQPATSEQLQEAFGGNGKQSKQTMSVAKNEIPKFYHDDESGEITETKPYPHAKPLQLSEIVEIFRNEIIGNELSEPFEQEKTVEQAATELEKETGQEGGITQVELRSVGPVAADPATDPGVGEITSVTPQEDETSGQVEEELNPQPVSKEKHDRAREIPKYSGEMAQAVATIEAEGGTVEEATPQGIAEAVLENEQVQKGLGVQHVFRDASTGEYVTEEYAAAHPDTTVKETVAETTPGDIPRDNSDNPVGAAKEGAVIVDAPPEIGNHPSPQNTTPVTVEDVAEQEKVQPEAAEGKRVLSIQEQSELTQDEVKELIRSGEVVLAQDIAQP